jgi:hypothetical protein
MDILDGAVKLHNVIRKYPERIGNLVAGTASSLAGSGKSKSQGSV